MCGSLVEKDGWGRILVIVIVLAIGILLVRRESGGDGVFVYSLTVDQVPQQVDGRMLRVEGELQRGSLRFREDPCEWRFVIEGEGHSMPVRFPFCVVPDTFRDSYPLELTIRGRVSDWGFEALELIPRCPTKYEMGMCEEDPPHALPFPADAAVD